MNLQILIEEKEQTSTFYLKGEVDVFTAPNLKEKLLTKLQNENTEVIIDLSDVHYMDSTGLGVLIGGLKAAKKSNSHIKLRNATPRLERLFTITGLVEVMEITQGEGA
jgi:anti-sigma B factor antagonist